MVWDRRTERKQRFLPQYEIYGVMHTKTRFVYVSLGLPREMYVGRIMHVAIFANFKEIGSETQKQIVSRFGPETYFYPVCMRV